MGFYPEEFPDVSSNSIIPDAFFLYLGVAVAAGSTLSSAADGVSKATKDYPQLVSLVALLGAWLFVYVLVAMANVLEDTAPAYPAIQLIRSSLVLGKQFAVDANYCPLSQCFVAKSWSREF